MEEINSVNMYNYLFLHVTTRDISVSTLFFDNSVGYLVNVCANINFNLGVNITVSLTGKFFFERSAPVRGIFTSFVQRKRRSCIPLTVDPLCMRIFHCDVELVTTKFENCHPVAKEM